MDDQLLVVGLGNPGPQYASNRHNVGHMVVDVLAARAAVGFKSHKAGAVVAEARRPPGGPKLLLTKPGTYMNLSGGPVAQLARFYKIEVPRVVVIHDDLDLDYDTVRIKSGGGHGGHNGLRDIIARLGTQDFVRVRVGIGRPPGRQDAADYVLHDFGVEERRTLPNLLEDAADAVERIAADGLLAAQNVVNQRG
ncbi:MAG TPA: aminoacyl-tRNA hydrolase [Microbacteriaceae bacterium]|nr:aminoacyl-tRNA hydrolase [Microbacteriaceae bacterium]